MPRVKRDPNVMIYKYVIDEPEDRVVFSMPKGAKILHVGNQREQICIWAKVDITCGMHDRAFYIVGTGHAMPVEAGEYIGTVHLFDSDFIWHIFEEKV